MNTIEIVRRASIFVGLIWPNLINGKFETAATPVPVYLDKQRSPDMRKKCGRNTQPASPLHTRRKTNIAAAIRERQQQLKPHSIQHCQLVVARPGQRKELTDYTRQSAAACRLWRLRWPSASRRKWVRISRHNFAVPPRISFWSQIIARPSARVWNN